MIIGNNREQVIQNIKTAANNRDFTAKVEVGDPVMSLQQRTALVDNFWKNQATLSSKLNNEVGKILLDTLAKTISASTEIKGLKYLKDLLKEVPL